jgi:uncharacterized protein
MKRSFEAVLRTWKRRPDRKPLVVKGARQTGKTFVIEQFGRSDYGSVHTLNFEADPRLATVFDGELAPERLLRDLALLGRFDPADAIAGRSLVFFDEVQICPRALTSLKYFAEHLPAAHLAAAGSLLGVELSQAAAFPVGKVELHTLYPLDFFEFLDATGREAYRVRLEQLDAIAPLAEGIHTDLIAAVKEYLFVGGMPEAVMAFGKERDFAAVRRIQQNIVAAYKLDFAKHAPATIVPRLAMLWDSLAGQLARENRRFLFSAVQEGGRARDFEEALLWLEQAGLVYRSYAVATPKLPLAGYCNRRLFKLFALDCGLLAAIANLTADVVLRGNDVFQEFKGALAEQYVAQQLVARGDTAEPPPLFYWRNEKTGTEVDFLIENGGVYPLEVKAGPNARSKSLASYREQFKPPKALRASVLNLKADADVINLPLSLLPAIDRIIQLAD